MDIKCFFAAIACFFMSACTTLPTSDKVVAEAKPQNTQYLQNKKLAEKHLNDALFTPIEISDADLFLLSGEQIAEFEAFYTHPKYAHLEEQQRFSEFLTTRLANFTYHGETYTATQAFETMSGNCLSLAILTTALAQHAGLDIRYQRVDAPPVYEKHGNILLLSTHVRTRVYGPEPEKPEGVFYISRPFVTIDYFPSDGDVRGKNLSFDGFLAMYHRNMAAQALIDQDYSLAYAYIKKGLNYDADHSETFNLLAVLFNQSKDEQNQFASEQATNAAMALYKDLITQNNSSINALENYVALLKQSEQTALAETYTKKLKGVNDDNPYQWLRLASMHYEQGEFRLAQKYAERAASLGPYLHEPQFLLAKTYFEMRRFGASRAALLKAKDMAKSSEDEIRYLAKLNALNKE